MTCPCGFVGDDLDLHSPEWYRAHRDHHLATSATDPGTRRNLDMAIQLAEERAHGMSNTEPAPPRQILAINADGQRYWIEESEYLARLRAERAAS